MLRCLHWLYFKLLYVSVKQQHNNTITTQNKRSQDKNHTTYSKEKMSATMTSHSESREEIHIRVQQNYKNTNNNTISEHYLKYIQNRTMKPLI